MKKKIILDNEVVTRGILKTVLKTEVTKIVKIEVKKEIKKEFDKRLPLERAWTQGKLNELEYRLTNRMDSRFDILQDIMQKSVDRVQQLADMVIKEHKEFEIESISIRHNYGTLEERVYRLEERVLPKV